MKKKPGIVGVYIYSQVTSTIDHKGHQSGQLYFFLELWTFSTNREQTSINQFPTMHFEKKHICPHTLFWTY